MSAVSTRRGVLAGLLASCAAVSDAQWRRPGLRLFAAGMPIAAVNAEGWSAELAGGVVGGAFPVTRQGFTAAGAAAGYTDWRVLTRRKRQAFPNQASDTANTVALDDYVYATDSIAGVVNNSTETSPRAIAAWVSPDRQLVGDTIGGAACPVELVAFHRDARAGRQVACVQFFVSDGTTTLGPITVAATTLSSGGWCEDANPIETFTLPATDISALLTSNSARKLTVNAKVYPWIGAAASVLDSADQAAARDFSPRSFYRSPALVAARPVAFVSSAGSDVTGVWSTSAGMAQAMPFKTVSGAVLAISGAVDGRIVYVVDTVAWFTSGNTAPSGKVCYAAGLTITRAPGTTRANAVVTIGGQGNVQVGMAGGSLVGEAVQVTLRDMTLRRIGYNYTVQNGLQFVNCIVDFGNQGLMLNNTSGSLIGNCSFYGCQLSGISGSTELGGTVELRILRGCAWDQVGNNYHQRFVIGCTVTRPGGGGFLNPGATSIVYGNRFLNPQATGMVRYFAAADTDTATGCAVVQNLVETVDASASPGRAVFTIGADSQVGSTAHVIVQHNTLTGHASWGRANLLYDDTPGGAAKRRTHRLQRVSGNLFASLNTKGDIFVGTNNGGSPDPVEGPFRAGNFAFTHGVGCQGNFTMFADAAGGTVTGFFNQTYPGLGSVIGSSSTVRNDPLFVDYKSTTGSPTAGVGGGSYALVPGSSARGIASTAVLGFDLAGTARGTGGQAAGSYK